MILSITAVSAADDVTSDLGDSQAVDEVSTPVDEPVATGDSGVLKSSQNTEILTDPGDKNFTVLQQEIDSSPGYLSVGSSNYVRADGESEVFINKSITIMGDDTHRIDANNLGGIFKLGQGASVSLINVILTNGNSENGGAIYNEGSLTLSSSQITDSSAINGGAIYNKGILTVTGSTLERNTATTLGGAIYSENILTVVDGAEFIDNKVTTASAYNPGVNCNGGGAIFSKDTTLQVEKAYFIENEAVHPEFGYFTAGGAIYVYQADEVLIKESFFEHNIAGLGGAVIFEDFSQSNVVVKDCYFGENEAWQGGAINVNEFVGDLSIAGNTFIGNKAVGPNLGGSSSTSNPASAGAISIGTMSTTGTSVEINECNFTQNTAEGAGGAIVINENTEAIIENCDFIQNEAGTAASAISASGNVAINGSRFNANKGPLGTIYLYESESSITNSNFTENDDPWGDILNNAGTLTLENNKIDTEVGIISWGAGSEIVTNYKISILGNGTYVTPDPTYLVTAVITDDGGNIIRDFVGGDFKFVVAGKKFNAVYNATTRSYQAICDIPFGENVVDIEYSGSSPLTVEKATITSYSGSFTDLAGKIADAIANHGGVLDLTYDFAYIEGVDEGAIDTSDNGYGGIIINKILTINGNNHIISGSKLSGIFDIYADVTFNNITFANAHMGAIYTESKLVINNCTFINNTAYDDNSDTYFDGGAIYSDGAELEIAGSVFTNNTADCGGAISIYNADITVTNCVFTDNTAVGDNDGSGYGGAISSDDKLTVNNCVFTNNIATTSVASPRYAPSGGAIDSGGYAIITNSNFTKNSAGEGGAIDNWQGTLEISNSNFTDNTATYKGGAIYNYEGILTVDNVNFTGNDITFRSGTADDDNGGAAIYNVEGILTIDNSRFTSNIKNYQGRTSGEIFDGAITTSGTVKVTNSNFTGNKGVYGGAITMTKVGDNNEGSITIDNCNFTDNFAYAGGAVYIGDSSYTNFEYTINNCRFENNIASGIGSPNYVASGGAVVINRNTKQGIVNGSTFIGNKLVQPVGDGDYGGAIATTRDTPIAIENCWFENNSAVTQGGAVFLWTTSSIENCTFVNNSASSAGAVAVYDGRVTIKNVTFDSNKAVEGGSILCKDNIDVSDSRFINNNATENGGAIYFTKYCTDSSVTNSNFTENVAGNNGGAIYINANVDTWVPDVTISNSKFTDNAAEGEGNAIYLDSGSKLSLAGNDMTGDGAAIVNNNGVVDSEIIVTILGGETVTVSSNEVVINATVTTNGAVLDDNTLKFTINGKNVTATYNEALGYYQGTYTLPGVGVYPVGMVSTKTGEVLDVTQGTINNVYGTFTDLQYKIGNATNGVLDLTYNFTYNEAIDGEGLIEGVVISNPITINGNGFTISGNNKARILKINANAETTLNDINFVKGYINKTNTNGGAINTASVLTVNGCNFSDNFVTGSPSVSGGAIYSNSANLTILNSKFNNNTAKQGAAINHYAYKGANLTIVNSSFTNNNVTGVNYGGAVYYVGSGTTGRVVSISGSKFINNTASPSNNAPGSGALYLNAPYNVIITDSEFIGNNGTNGGAIYYSFGAKNVISNLTVDGCNFTNNSATGNGEAIYFYIGGNRGNISADIKGSKFTNNGAADEYAIYSFTPYKSVALALEGNTIDNIIYNGGTITSKVNAVVLDNKTVETAEDTYPLNATLTDDNGNKIYDPNLKFKVNDDESVSFTSYENGVYTYDAYAIGFEPKYVVNVTSTGEEKLNVKTGIIKNLKAGTYTDLAAKIADAIANNEGVLDLSYDFEYTEAIDGANFPQGVVITQDIIINGNGYTISANDASVNIFTINSGAATLSNITFTGVNGDTSLKYGAVVNKGNLTIDNCTFKDNAINKVSSGNGGAAVFNTGTSLVISDSRFINNTAPWSGSTGAVSSWVNSYLLIENSYFEGNLARFGAAIEIEELDQKEVAVRNCTFFNNSGYSGVSINANANVKYLNVTNCTFDSNNFHGPQGAPTTGGMGAGITAGTARKVPVTLEVSDSIFKNNYGDDQDGSVCAAIRLADCASGIITNCTFENNYGTPNVAISAGTIHNDTATVTVKDSTFIGNDATNGMTVRISPGIDASVENCNFSADTNDIAIYNSGTLSLSKNTIDSVIYNKGTITSETNVTVLRNGTVNAKYGQIVTLNATYTDDNGNSIYDPNFKFTVAGVADPIDAVYADGVYTATYKADKVEEKVVSAELPYDVDTYNGLLDIGPATVILTIDANETIMRKQNETITINLVDEFGNLLNLSLNVVVQNSAEEDVFSETITTQNGTYTFNLTGLGVDTYKITAVFMDDNYVPNPKIVSKPFEVTPLEINGTYTDLQKQIDETLENGVLILPYDFAYDDFVDEDFFPYGVIINKNITIDGNGSTISGSKVYRIFNITAGNVVFNNITFVDGIADNGGAIYANSTEDITVTILNSTFANNTATIGGGAVAFMSDDDSKVTYYIIDSLFENNTATGTYSEDESVAGGAVYSEGITDWCYIGFTTFKNNKAIKGKMPNGGAVEVQFGGKLIVLNSTFEDNFAEYVGGAIDVQSKTNMNCTVLILNTKFENNKAGMAGAAVSAIETSGNSIVGIINSTIENNVADITAHAIYVSPSSSVAVINTTLAGNGGDTDYGIYNLGKLALINNTVSNIILTYSAYGEGIITTDTYARILENQTFDITSDSFTLQATLTDDNGNRIYDPNMEFTINGVAIDAVPGYDKESGWYTLTYTGLTTGIYVVNVTSGNEKKLNTEVGILRNIKGTYTDLQNLINDAEGALVLPYNFAYNEEIDSDKFYDGILINKSIAIDGKGYTINGSDASYIFLVNVTGDGAVTFDNITFADSIGAVSAYSKLSVNDCTFIDNHNYDNGGAIYVNGSDITITGSTFANNTGFEGGAIYIIDCNATITGSEFTNNTATGDGAHGGSGGAISCDGDTLNIDNCVFTDNTALPGDPDLGDLWESWGGAVEACQNAVITNSKFNNNNATNAGAISIVWGDNVEISNSNFTDNTAVYGGAIFVLNTFDNNNVTVGCCTFTGNKATKVAGAIYNGDESVLSVENSIFTGNEAEVADAIYNSAMGECNGVLSLFNNTISSTKAEIVNDGILNSTINGIVLTGLDPIYIYDGNVELYAVVTDDNGNLINDSNFVFQIYDEFIDPAERSNLVKSVPATFNGEKFVADTTLDLGVYQVAMNNTKYSTLDDAGFSEIESGEVRYIVGTFTDLQKQIDGAVAAGNTTLDLPYDFTYNNKIDNVAFSPGVILADGLTINGNNHYLDGNNTASILRIWYSSAAINDIEFRNGGTDDNDGGTINIYSSNLNINNCTFVNCSSPTIYNVYVPIQVYVIYDEATYDAVLAIENGPLQKYYAKYPTEDVDPNDPRGHSWAAVQAANLKTDVSELPWVVLNMDEPFTGNISVDYNDSEKFSDWHVVEKTFAIISVTNPDDMGMKEFALWGNTTYGNASDFKPDLIRVLLDDDNGFDSYFVCIAPMTVDVVISDSTFIFDDDDAYPIENHGNLTLKGNEMSGRVFNYGNLSLDKNTVNGVIYNYGTITSEINVKVLNNETIPGELGQTFKLNATVKDDNGNFIEDTRFNITVQGEALATTYDPNTKLYEAEYKIVNVGENVVSVAYPVSEADLNILVGIIDVPKANVTVFNVTPRNDRVPYGENVTIDVTLLGIEGVGLNETFNVVVNNVEYPVTVVNGTGSFNVSGLAPGQYAAFGMFTGNDMYNKAYATGIFTVLEPEAKLTIEIEDITVGDVLIVKVNLTDAEGNPIFGTVDVVIANTSFPIIVTGNGSFEVLNAPAGNYTAVATLVADASYASVNNTTTFEVKKISDYDFIASVGTETEFGETVYVDVTLPKDATGDVNITINGETYSASVEKGSATIEIPGLAIGDYLEVEVLYSGDKTYVPGTTTVDIYVVPVDPEFSAWAAEAYISYGENATIIIDINENATGTISVYSYDWFTEEDTFLFNVTVDEAREGINITGLGLGDYYYDLVYSGDDIFDEDTAGAYVTVEKAVIDWGIAEVPDEITVGETVTIVLNWTDPEGAQGKLNITLDGEELGVYTFDEAREGITLDIFDKSGEYNITVAAVDDPNYDYAEPIECIIFVNTIEPEMEVNITEDPKVGDVIEAIVTLPEDATGVVDVYVDGELIEEGVELVDGTATIDLGDLAAGNHTVIISYLGDDVYSEAMSIITFEVTKADLELEIDVDASELVAGDDVEVTIYASEEDADNYVIVDVNGKSYSGKFEDGMYSFTIEDLDATTYEIVATYVGDDKYNEVTCSTSFTVGKSGSAVAAVVPASIDEGDDVAITVAVRPSEATGNITVYVDGVEYDTYDIGDEIIITGLENGTHTIGVQYNGDDNYNASELMEYPITVRYVITKEDVHRYGSISTYGYNSSVILEFDFDDVTGNITLVYYDIQEGYIYYNGTVENGRGIIWLPVMPVGEYDNLPFIYSGDDKYTGLVTTVGFVVLPIETVMDVVPSEDNKVGDVANVTVTVGPKYPIDPEITVPGLTGTVDVYVDGNLVAEGAELVDGTVTVPVEGLAAGNHTVAVYYSGDDIYDECIGGTTLKVDKADPEITISDIEGNVGDTFEATVTIEGGDATGYVFFDGNLYVVENGQTTIEVVIEQAGMQAIFVTYTGDDKYNDGTGAIEFNAGKAASSVDAIVPSEANVGDDVPVEVTVSPDEATGTVTVYVDGNEYQTYDIDDEIIISGLTNGTHTIGVKYDGDDNYNASEVVEYTIEVSKVDVSDDIEIEGSKVAYGENATVTLMGLPEDATGTVTVTIGDNEYTANVEDGIAIVEIPGLDADLYEFIKVEYSGDDKYTNATGMATIEVKPAYIDWGLADVPEEIEVNDTVAIVLDWTDPEDASGKLNITLNGEYVGEYTFDEVRDGIVIDKFTKPGEYTIVVSAVDDPNYEYAEPLEYKVNVATIDPDMDVDVPSDAKVGETAVVTVTLPADATGNVTVIVDGKEYDDAEVMDGVAVISVEGLNAGNHTVVVVYTGDDQYSPVVSDDINLEVTKADPSIVVEVDDINVGDNATVKVTVPEDAVGFVLIEVGDVKSYGEIENGIATISVPGLAEGNYTVTATFTGDNKYNKAENTTQIKVNKVAEYNMTVDSSSEDGKVTVNVTLPEDAQGTVTVTDENGNSQTVPVENGAATVTVDNLAPGETNLTVSYSGDDKYEPKETNVTANNTKKDVVLTAIKLEMYVGDGSQFTVVLKDTAGKPISGKGIKVNICGKTYTIKTNSEGIAVLPINLRTGSYPVYVWFAGDANYNPSENVSSSVDVYTKVRISENKDLVKTEGGSEKFTVRALDKYGKPVGAYAKVKMTISGKTYTVNTDANGYASLPINLKAGTYQIVTEYGGTTVTNTVTVKSK